jgi:hypothetical protein
MNFGKAGHVFSVVLDDSLQYPGDATVSYTYDDLHRLTRETCTPAQGSYRVGYDYRYYYDAVGNRTGKTIGSGIGRLEITYSYSPRNELISETTYVVDQDEQGEEVWVQIAGVEYSYDLRGNLVKKGDPDGYRLGVGERCGVSLSGGRRAGGFSNDRSVSQSPLVGEGTARGISAPLGIQPGNYPRRSLSAKSASLPLADSSQDSLLSWSTNTRPQRQFDVGWMDRL